MRKPQQRMTTENNKGESQHISTTGNHKIYQYASTTTENINR